MSSDLEGSSNQGSSPASEDDSSDTDLATILTQLIRSGRAHILSERNATVERGDFFHEFPRPHPPLVDHKPDLTALKDSDLYLATSQSSGYMKHMKVKDSHSKQIAQVILQRQIGMPKTGNFSEGDRSFISHNYLPNQFEVAASFGPKVFCGTFSKDGNTFLSASQDRLIRVFDTSQGKFNCIKKIHARDVGWSIVDTAFSPDGRSVIYSSWSDSIHLCNIKGDTETHEVFPLSPEIRRFCIFSLTFSQDGNEVLGGANDGCLYVYDCVRNQRILRIDAHDEDVNAVAYADETSQIFFSGADDGLCKVWDRRSLSESGEAKPVGILAGHVDGLTFVDSRGDGRHLITNSKDQSIKLWDMRKFSGSDAQERTRSAVQTQNWDYSFQNVPWRLACSKTKIAGDTSLMTYKGHSVLRTLIRCRFSPAFSTGQRYIYSGCASGKVYIYDVLTGVPITTLSGHTECVRDVSWHPYFLEIVDSSWDGRHFKWTHGNIDSDEEDLLVESYDSEVDSSDSDEHLYWRQRRTSNENRGNDDVRRSARIAARSTSNSSGRRTSQRLKVARRADP